MEEPETETTLEDLEETRDGLVKTLEWLNEKIRDKARTRESEQVRFEKAIEKSHDKQDNNKQHPTTCK